MNHKPFHPEPEAAYPHATHMVYQPLQEQPHGMMMGYPTLPPPPQPPFPPQMVFNQGNQMLTNFPTEVYTSDGYPLQAQPPLRQVYNYAFNPNTQKLKLPPDQRGSGPGGLTNEVQWIPRSETKGDVPNPNDGFAHLSYFMPGQLEMPANRMVYTDPHPNAAAPRYLQPYGVELKMKYENGPYLSNGQSTELTSPYHHNHDFHLKPLANRKRVATLPRSKKGCWVCRIRHLKCDEQRPGCLSCLRLDLECDYRDERPSYVLDKREKAEKLREISRIWKSKTNKKKVRK